MRFTVSPELVCAIDPVTSSTSMTSTFEISSFAVQFADKRNSSLPNMNINSVGKTADACPATYEAFMACEEKRMPDAPYLASGKLKLNILSASARSEEHKSALPSLMRKSYAVFCLT